MKIKAQLMTKPDEVGKEGNQQVDSLPEKSPIPAPSEVCKKRCGRRGYTCCDRALIVVCIISGLVLAFSVSAKIIEHVRGGGRHETMIQGRCYVMTVRSHGTHSCANPQYQHDGNRHGWWDADTKYGWDESGHFHEEPMDKDGLMDPMPEGPNMGEKEPLEKEPLPPAEKSRVVRSFDREEQEFRCAEIVVKVLSAKHHGESGEEEDDHMTEKKPFCPGGLTPPEEPENDKEPPMAKPDAELPPHRVRRMEHHRSGSHGDKSHEDDRKDKHRGEDRDEDNREESPEKRREHDEFMADENQVEPEKLMGPEVNVDKFIQSMFLRNGMHGGSGASVHHATLYNNLYTMEKHPQCSSSHCESNPEENDAFHSKWKNAERTGGGFACIFNKHDKHKVMFLGHDIDVSPQHMRVVKCLRFVGMVGCSVLLFICCTAFIVRRIRFYRGLRQQMLAANANQTPSTDYPQVCLEVTVEDGKLAKEKEAMESNEELEGPPTPRSVWNVDPPAFIQAPPAYEGFKKAKAESDA